MRTKPITIHGVDYPAIVSNRVNLELQERGYNSVADAIKELAAGKIKPFWMLLELCLDAGYRWEKMNGNAAQKPPKIDDIIDTTTADDIETISDQLIAAMGFSSQPTIEAEETGKNVVAAQ